MANSATINIRITSNASGLVATVNGATAAVKNLGAAGQTAGQQTAQGQAAAQASIQKTAAVAKQASASMQQSLGKSAFVGGLDTVLSGMRSQMLAIIGIAAVFKGVFFIRESIDGWIQLSARIKLVTTSTKEYNQALEGLYKISQDTGTALDATGLFYARAARSIKQLGGNQGDVLAITKALSQSFIISGASAEESAASMRQLTQAFSKGYLNGDEFNSVTENSPRILQALTDALGVTTGALRKMSQNNQLSSELIARALVSQAHTIEEEYSRIPITIARAWVRVTNALERFIGQADEASRFSRFVVAGLTGLAAGIDQIGQTLSAVASEGLAALLRLGYGALRLWEDIRAGAEAMWVAISSFFSNGVNGVRNDLANLAEGAGKALAESSIPGASRVSKMFTELSASLRPAKDAIVDVGAALEGVGAQSQAEIADLDRVKNKGLEFAASLYKVKDAAVGLNTSLKLTEAEKATALLKGFKGQMDKTEESLKKQTAQMAKGKVGLVEFQKAQVMDAAASLLHGKALEEFRTQVDAAAASAMAAAKKEDMLAAGKRNHAREQQILNERINAALHANQEFYDLEKQLVEHLKGPMASAVSAYNHGLDVLGKETEALEFQLTRHLITYKEYEKGIKAVTDAYKDLDRWLERQKEKHKEQIDLVGQVTREMNEQLRVRGLTGVQLAVETALVQKENQARELYYAGEREGIELSKQEAENIRTIVSLRYAEIEALDNLKAVWENYKGIVLGGMNELASVFSKWVFSSEHKWKDLWKGMIDTVRNSLAQIMAIILQQRITIPIAAQLLGVPTTSLGGISGIGGLAGASGGGNTGLLSTLLGSGGAGIRLFGSGQVAGDAFMPGASGGAAAFGAPSALQLGGLGAGAGLLYAGYQRRSPAMAGVGGALAAYSGISMAASGVFGGALAGAAAGSVVPIVGTLIGFAVGAIIAYMHKKPLPPEIEVAGSAGSVRRVENQGSSAFGSVRINTVGTGQIPSADVLKAIIDFDNQISQLFTSDQIAAASARLQTFDVDLKKGAATIDNLLGQRFAAILSTLPADVQAAVKGAGDLKAQVEALAAVLAKPGLLKSLLDQLGEADKLAGMSEAARQTYQINKQFDEYIAQARVLGATTADLTQIDEYRANALSRIGSDLVTETENAVRAQTEYANYIVGIADSMARMGRSDFQNTLIDLARAFNESVKSANDLAHAAGLESAREEDLALIRRYALAQLDVAVRELEMNAADSVSRLGYTAVATTNALDTVSDGFERVIESAQSFKDKLLLDDSLSPLNDQQKWQEALRQAQASGDQETITRGLEILRRLTATGADYTQGFNLITSFAKDKVSESGGPNDSASALGNLTPAQRFSEARTLSQEIADLAGVRGTSFSEVAKSLGFDLSQLGDDLGLTSEKLDEYLKSLQLSTYSLDDWAAILKEQVDRIVAAIQNTTAQPLDKGDILVKPPGKGSAGGSGSSGEPAVSTSDAGVGVQLDKLTDKNDRNSGIIAKVTQDSGTSVVAALDRVVQSVDLLRQDVRAQTNRNMQSRSTTK